MSIYIGNSPPENIKTGITDKVLTISTNNSNAIDLNSLNNNVLVTIGDYIIGQHSNISTNYEKEFHISNNQDIIAKLEKNNNVFTKDTSINNNLSVVGNIQINNDLTMNNITISDSVSMIKDSVTNTLNIETSNISVVNSDSNQILLQVVNNDIPIVYVSNKDNGQMYIEGGIGIGTTLQEGYGIYTESNIRIEKTLDSSNIFTNSIEYSESSITGIYMTDKVLTIGGENVAAQTLIDNFTVGDTINLTSVVVSDSTYINNNLFASNVTITNNNANISPLRIINKDVNDTIPVLKVLSEYSSNNDVYTSNIFQITSKGHIVMGVYSDTDTSISDKEYMIRGDIDSIRTPYFNGFLHFTNSNVYQNTTVSQEGYIGIGNGNSNITSMLQIKNNLYGNENTTIPDNFIQLENVLSSNNSTNKLSFVKGISNNNTLFEITSNGSLIFDNIPIDINEYNIAASNIKVYNLDTQNIDNISGNPISFEYNTLSNVTNIYGVTFFASNAIMYNDLNVGSYNIQLAELISVEDYGLTTIHMLAEKVLMTPDNFALGVTTTHYSEPLNRIDTLYLTTESIPQGSNVQAFYAEGSNNNIILTNNNSNTSIYGITTDNTISLSEYIVNDNKFVIEAVNRSETPGENAYLLIHSGDSISPQDKVGIVILKNNDIQFTDKVFINKDGFLSIDTIEQNTTDRLTVKGSVNIFNTNNIPTFNIKNDGRVGFATNLPLASMYLHNTLDNTIFNIYDTTCNITPFIIDRNGNVGIGTDNTSLGKLTLDNGDILPSSSNVFTLGNINYRWNSNLYFESSNLKDYILLQDVKLISSSNDGLILEKINNNDYIPFYYTSNNVNYEFYTNSNTMINQYFEKDYINITKNDSDLYYYNRGERIVGDWTISNNFSSNITSLTASCWSSNHNQFVAFGESFIGLNRYKRLGYHWGDVDYVNPENSIETVVVKEKIDFLYSSSYNWSYLFTGYFVPSSSGVWTFTLYADNRTYIWLGDYAISGYTTGNYFLSVDVTIQNNTITLTKGVMYPIRILFGEAGGIAGLALTFSGPDTPTTNDISKHFRTGNTDNAYTRSKDGKSWSNIDLLLSENNTNIYNSICWSSEKEKYVAVGYDYGTNNTTKSVILNSSDSINWTPRNDLNVIVDSIELYNNYTTLQNAYTSNDDIIVLTNYNSSNFEFIFTSNISYGVYELVLNNNTSPTSFVQQPIKTGTVYWNHPQPLNNQYAILFDIWSGNGTGGDYTEIRFNTSNYNEHSNPSIVAGTVEYTGYTIRFNEYINSSENRISLFKKSTEVYSSIGLYNIDDMSWRTMKIYYNYNDITEQSEISLKQIVGYSEVTILSYTDTEPILNPIESYISFNANTSNETNTHLIKDIYYYNNNSNFILTTPLVIPNTYYKWNDVIYSPEQDLFVAVGESYKKLYDNCNILQNATVNNGEIILTDYSITPLTTGTVYWEHPEVLHNKYAISFDMWAGSGSGSNFTEIRFNTSNTNESWNTEIVANTVNYEGYNVRFDSYINGNENRISLFKKSSEVSSKTGLYDIDDMSWRTMKIYYQYDNVSSNSEISLTRIVRDKEETILSYTDTTPILNPSESYISINATTSNATSSHLIKNVYYHNNSNIINSENGNDWRLVESVYPSQLQSVCWSPEKSLYAAISKQGYNNVILTSSDSINWTSQNSPNNVLWNSICYSSELELFVAVGAKGNNNGVITSPNGIDWTQRYCHVGGWNKVIWVSELKQFVATGEGNEFMLSIDGIYWKIENAPFNRWNDISWSSELYRYLSVGYNNVITQDVVTNIPGLMAWYTGKSWNGTSWEDISGNGNHCTEIRGTINNNSTQHFIYGTTNSGIRFPSNILPQNYTLFHVANYNGTNRRIFDGVNSNWLSGFHGGRSGVAAHGADKWITSQTNNFGLKIVVSTDQRTLYRGNGIDFTIGSISTTANERLSINYGYYTYSPNVTETSDWVVFEVIVYDRELSLSEIKVVEEYLRKKYDDHTEYSISDYSTKALISGNPNPVSASFGLDLETGPGGLNVIAPVVNKELAWTTRVSAADNNWHGITWAPELGLFVAVAYTVTKEPAFDMTANTTVTAVGNYIASASSEYTLAYTAFDNVITDNQGWHSSSLGTYNSSTGGYTGSDSLGGYSGEWIKLQLPYSVPLSIFKYKPRRSGYLNRAPKEGVILGSNDNTNWSLLYSFSNQIFTSVDEFKYLNINSTTEYLYYAMVIIKNNGDAFACIGEIQLLPYGFDNVMTSPDGINWTSRTSATDNQWTDITWAPELGLFVAVADSGTNNRVMTSPDGINWTTRTTPVDIVWFNITWAPELGLLVAVAFSGTGNRVMTSPDGINWTTRSTPVNNAWISIVWAPELGLLVAVAWSGSGNRVMTSPDGINWTTRSSAANNEWMGICWSPELTLLVAVGRTGTNNRIMTSPDGINWTTRSSAADNNWRDVVWAPELGLFVAVSSSGTGNHVMTSSDGINWTTRSSAADNVWNSITWAPELGLFVAGTGDRVITAEGTKTNKTVLSVKNEKVYVNNSLGIGIEPSNTTGLAIKQPFEPYYTGSSGNTLLHSPGIELQSDTIRTSIFINHNKDLIFSSANYEDNYKGATGYVDYGVRNVKMNFTGQHRCFVDNVSYENLLSFQGLIVSANKNSYRNMSGGLTTGKKAITINESLPVVSITTTSKDRNVFGVISTVEDVENRLDRFGSFVTPYEKIKGDTRAYINSVGEGGIWVSNKRGTLLSGSYITSSDIPGYGEKQDDYILRNYTVAKITMDCDFNPKLIPIKKIKKTEVTENAGSNIITTITNELDEYGNIILEDTEEMEYEYQLRYILQNGDIITENDYLQRIKRGETVYKAAFVGCTYHSG